MYNSNLDLMRDVSRGSLCEENDCAVRAIAAATAVSYLTAHTALASAGRPYRTGTHWRQVLAALTQLGFAYETPFGEPRSCTHFRIPFNTKQMARYASAGRWIVSPTRHYVAIVDGMYSDSTGLLRRARPLTGAIRII